MKRKIKLEGANNARDLGGIVNREGRKIKSLNFIRSNSLDALSEADRTMLSEKYRLGKVIDLRTDVEAEEKPDLVPEGVSFTKIPVFKEETAGITHEKGNEGKLSMLEHCPEFTELYARMIRDEYSREALRKVFAEIVNKPEESAVLWHCSEGKDRCGLVSALTLCILDVDIRKIYRDYLLTNRVAYKKGLKYFILVFLATKRLSLAAKSFRIFVARRVYLDAVFREINALSGSLDNFIRDELGIDDGMKAAFKAKYLC